VILSVSRRTDIPAFYSEWFFKRIEDGYVMVRNPMNRHQVSKISLKRDVVDCFVFWTKNPKEMLNRLYLLDKMRYNYYFQFTLNPYGADIEVNVPQKREIINTFIRLSEKIGKNKVIWRYDPILLTDKITVDYHIKYFDYLASKLKDYTEKCMISFIDLYKKCQRNLKTIEPLDFNDDIKRLLSENIFRIAQSYGLKLETCAEDVDLSSIGIPHGKCIDDNLISQICGGEIEYGKDKTQRDVCGCIASIDIGEYNTCSHNCLYCYANYDHETVKKNVLAHNPKSPLLIGEERNTDKIYERKMKNCLKLQNEFLNFQYEQTI